jgi:N,N'-diacetyllegionaminate synthase
MKYRTLIIAEAGVNHNGDLAVARRLVDAAADAGADLVKFQTFRAERLATATADKADYQKAGSGPPESQLEMLRRLELSEDAHRNLLAYCQSRGIGFFSTGFDTECVDMLVGLGQRLFKIPSGEVTNLPYLRHVGGLGGDVILSTGMATLSDIEAALLVLERSGTPRERVTVLHCTTEYPTAAHDVNLRAMQSMRDAFGVRVGYSDHTQGIEISIAAVALGATVIEKHFTLDRRLPGPDHQASLEPGELASMVRCIRHVEVALGDGVKRPTAGEERNRAVARKSIVASRPIAAGEVFSNDNLTAKRPGSGVSPMRWDEVVGRRATRAYAADDLVDP